MESLINDDTALFARFVRTPVLPTTARIIRSFPVTADVILGVQIRVSHSMDKYDRRGSLVYLYRFNKSGSTVHCAVGYPRKLHGISSRPRREEADSFFNSAVQRVYFP